MVTVREVRVHLLSGVVVPPADLLMLCCTSDDSWCEISSISGSCRSIFSFCSFTSDCSLSTLSFNTSTSSRRTDRRISFPLYTLKPWQGVNRSSSRVATRTNWTDIVRRCARGGVWRATEASPLWHVCCRRANHYRPSAILRQAPPMTGATSRALHIRIFSVFR